MDIGLTTTALTRIPFEKCFACIDQPPLNPVFEIERAFLRKKQSASRDPES